MSCRLHDSKGLARIVPMALKPDDQSALARYIDCQRRMNSENRQAARKAGR